MPAFPSSRGRSHELRGSRCRRAGVSRSKSRVERCSVLLLRGCWRWCSSSRSVASRPWRRRRAGPCSGHLLHAVRRRLDGPGQAPRHGRDGRRHRLRHRDRDPRAGGPQLRTGALDGAVADVRLRLHRADRVVGGHHAGRQLARGGGPRSQQQGRHVVLGPAGPLDVRRQVRAPHHRVTPVRRPGRGRRRRGRSAAAAGWSPGRSASRSSASPAPPARPWPASA